MNDLTAVPDTAGTVNLSTHLTSGTSDQGIGGGKPQLGQPEEPKSFRDALAEEFRKEDEARAAKEKPEEGKAAKPDEGKEPAKLDKGKAQDAKTDEARPQTKAEVEGSPEAETEAQPVKAARRESEVADEDDRRAPPARLTEEAKPLWRSTPRAIKSEFQRLEQELTRVTQESGEAMRLHSELREYDGLARQHNTTIKNALDRYVQFDRLIMQDFGKGVAAIAQDAGKPPQEVISGVLRAYGLTPQQYAAHVIKNPQAHQPQPQMQAPPPDPRLDQVLQHVQGLTQRIEAQEREATLTTLQSEVQRWAADKPDYDEKEAAIAEILKSGIIERIHGQGLSVVQRLDAAYRMAGGAGPDLRQSKQESLPRANSDDAGKKSVRGAPSDGLTPDTAETETDLRAFLRKELRKMSG